MSKGTTINNHKDLTINKKITTYIKPQIVYVPLESKMGVEYQHLVKEGDYVYKGDIVAINKDIKIPIHSSVSGYVTKGIKKIINNGKLIKCIAIENDFKEKYKENIGSKRNINKYTKDKFLRLLQASGITGLSGSDYPTFLKYRASSNPQYLIVNGVECEPYVTADHSVMLENAEDILECVDAIIEIMSLKKAYIVLKETNGACLSEFGKYKGSYPNIILTTVADAYPSGYERSIVKDVLNMTYNKYPSEIGIIVNNVSTIYAIYETLKYNRPLTERVITVTGNDLKNPSNVRVKIGASIREIIHYLDGYKDLKNPLFIAGGPMMGTSLPTDDVIITKDLNCVIVIENDFLSSSPCIKCSKCISICPVNIMPVCIKDNLNNEDKLKSLEPSKCIECGLCSYICPAKIELREHVRQAKRKKDE